MSVQHEPSWKQQQVERYRKQMIENTEFRLQWAKKFGYTAEQIQQLEQRLERIRSAK